MKDLEIYACDSYYFNELNALFVSSICCDLCLIVLTFIVTIFMYILLLSTDVLFCVALIFCYLAVLLLTGGCYSYWGCGTNTEQKFYVKWIVFHPWTCNVYWLPSNRYVDAAAYALLAQTFEAKIIYPWVWLRLLTSERIPHTDGSCMAYRL